MVGVLLNGADAEERCVASALLQLPRTWTPNLRNPHPASHRTSDFRSSSPLSFVAFSRHTRRKRTLFAAAAPVNPTSMTANTAVMPDKTLVIPARSFVVLANTLVLPTNSLVLPANSLVICAHSLVIPAKAGIYPPPSRRRAQVANLRYRRIGPLHARVFILHFVARENTNEPAMNRQTAPESSRL